MCQIAWFYHSNNIYSKQIFDNTSANIAKAVCEMGPYQERSNFPCHTHVSPKLTGLICSCWVAERNGTASSGSCQYSPGRRLSISINIDLAYWWIHCAEGHGVSKQNIYGLWSLMPLGYIRLAIYIDNIVDSRSVKICVDNSELHKNQSTGVCPPIKFFNSGGIIYNLVEGIWLNINAQPLFVSDSSSINFVVTFFERNN